MLYGEAKTSPFQKEHTNVDSFFPLLLSLNLDLKDSLGVWNLFISSFIHLKFISSN